MHNPAESPTCLTLPLTSWQPEVERDAQQAAIEALEAGKVVFLPNLPFMLDIQEKTYLRPEIVKPSTKTVKYSLARHTLWGTEPDYIDSPVLHAMLKRYATESRNLIAALFPDYAPTLKHGNTSFRPVEAQGRAQSKRQDDQLLHVDAFPSRPNHGRRILRVFSNVHPGDLPRLWRVGEPFPEVAARFAPKLPMPIPGSAWLLKLAKLTKGLRSPYDHLMLKLHDTMKLDDAYQAETPGTTLAFPPGSTWIVYTDQVSHAAVSGQHAMEQTFSLPLSALRYPAQAPLRVLEGIKGRKLAKG